MITKQTTKQQKPVQPGKNVRIEDGIFDLLRKYCDQHALRMGVFVSRIIEEKIKSSSHE
jgi:hypothetical protein